MGRKPPPPDARRELTALLEEVVSSTRALSSLLQESSDLDADVQKEMRAASTEIDRCLARDRITVILLGESKARREVLDAILGAEVFGEGKEALESTTILRSVEKLDYKAKLKSGMIEEFASRIPDRTQTFAAALARAQREAESAEEATHALTSRMDEANAQLASKQEVFDEQPPQAAIRPMAWSGEFVPTTVGPLPSPEPKPDPPKPEPKPDPKPPEPVGFFAQLWAWILALFGSKPALPPPSAPQSLPVPAMPVALPLGSEIVKLREQVSVLDIDLDHARARLEQAKARIVQLEEDTERYAQERRTSYFGEVRLLVDADAKGKELVELTLELPCELLPVGIDLVEAPGITSKKNEDRAKHRELLRDADGCLLVTDAKGDTTSGVSAVMQEIHPVTPRVVRGLAAVPELPRLFERIRSERPLIVGARAIALVRPCIAKAAENGAKAEKSSRERVQALEKQRILDPKEFRTRAMTRIEKAIQDGSNDVVNSALERLQVRMGDIRTEWRAAINGCKSRGEVEACVKSINENASKRLTNVVEEVSEVVITEMQKSSDSLQVWVLEELHSRYEVARRLSMADPSPVISESVADELASLKNAPLAGTMEKFEGQRVGIGLGGAAIGAAVGTLIVPGIGTAIGAFVGVFAGFLKGVDSLKKDCLGKLEPVLDGAENEVKTQITARTAKFADAIRSSIEDRFDEAMQRFEQSIARLMGLEKKVLDKEKAKLARLAELQSTLTSHEQRFAELAKLAAKVAKTALSPTAQK